MNQYQELKKELQELGLPKRTCERYSRGEWKIPESILTLIKKQNMENAKEIVA